VCVGPRAARFDVPAGLEAILVIPHKHVRTAKARAAMPAQVPLADAVQNVGHASMLVLGLQQGDWELVSAGLHDRLHQPRRAPLYPQSMALVRRAQELGALGATISGAGPSVLFWTHYETTGAVMAKLKPATAGWAQLLHVPFEPQGAFVREL
jgi:homoserine kinase